MTFLPVLFVTKFEPAIFLSHLHRVGQDKNPESKPCSLAEKATVNYSPLLRHFCILSTFKSELNIFRCHASNTQNSLTRSAEPGSIKSKLVQLQIQSLQFVQFHQLIVPDFVKRRTILSLFRLFVNRAALPSIVTSEFFATLVKMLKETNVLKMIGKITLSRLQ